MTLNFSRVWASEFDRSVDYPTENQAKRGFSFLGTEAPIFELHDAIFQDEDKKAKWLYDQVRIACERFGQQVQKDDGSLISDARDTMANAITNALLTQRKADEGGHGIVRMANSEQTQAGQEYNMAVSPKHLAEFVDSYTRWANIKDKPQTATRWPDYSEVTNTPIFGSAAWKSASDFDPAGSAGGVYKSSVQRDSSYRAGFIGGKIDSPYLEHSVDGKDTIVPLAPTSWVNGRFSSLGSAAYASTSDFDSAGSAGNVYRSSVQRDRSYRAGFQGGDILKPYMEHSDGGKDTIVPLARAAWVSEVQGSLQNYPLREQISRIGLASGDLARPFMTSDSGASVRLATFDQAVPVTTGNRKAGTRIWNDGYVEQWGEYWYDDIIDVSRFTFKFPRAFTEILSCVAVVDSIQDVYLTRFNLDENGCSFILREWGQITRGGNIAWKATGWIR